MQALSPRPRVGDVGDTLLLERLRRLGSEPRAWQTPAPLEGFVFGRLLGEGGMGRVYEALQLNPRRRVAIKVLRATSTGARASLLRREADALGRLDHPGIARVHCAGAGADGAPYIVMEHVDGRPLDQWAAGRTPTEIVAVMERVCRAIQHAHERGVVHRDLKPSNVLVDAEGQPRVLDFGLARIADDVGAGTIDGRIAGTLAYMSPEQVGGVRGAVGARSDVYALGVILYELLTGRLPVSVEDRSIAQVIDDIRHASAPPPSSVRAAVPSSLDGIVQRALEKRPGARHAGAGDLGDELASWMNGKRDRRRARIRVRRKLLLCIASLLVMNLSVRPGEPGESGTSPGSVPTALRLSEPVLRRLAPNFTVAGDLGEIERMLRERLANAEPGENEGRFVLGRLALVLEAQGRYVEAEGMHRQCAAAERGWTARRIICLTLAARCMAGQGRYDAARDLFSDCRRRAERLHAGRENIGVHIDVAEARAATADGELDRALELLERARADLATGVPHESWSNYTYLAARAELADARGDHTSAERYREQAERIYAEEKMIAACQI